MKRSSTPAMRALGWLAAALSALAGAGCSGNTKTHAACQSDADCGKFSCVQGTCMCTADVQCGAGQMCNSAGYCQQVRGCQSTLDCPKGQFCDITTGNCLDENRCTVDVQCPFGQVCDQIRFECVDGCRDSGDCNLGSVCECPDGQPRCADPKNCPTGFEGCSQLGTCASGPCADNSYCKYGQICQSQGQGAPDRCVNDTSGPFCQPCTIGPGQDYCPGDAANFCLVDTSKAYGSYFCGVQCQQDTDCPWGYGCDDVLILTQQTCGSANQCQTHDDMPCQTDQDCPGGECDTSTHLCRSICIANEGDVQGFCTCLEDSDCPIDTCGSDGHCTISRKMCDANNPCPNIYCKTSTDPQTKKTVGYCFIGRNCAPSEGLSCDQITNQSP